MDDTSMVVMGQDGLKGRMDESQCFIWVAARSLKE